MTDTLDDWPYPSPVFVPRDEKGPTWGCPDLTCDCHGNGDGEQERHELVFFDHRGLRMPAARVRAHLNGRLLTSLPRETEGDGSLRFDLPTAAHELFLEWAPGNLPSDPRLPYQLGYVLQVSGVFPRNYSERLTDLGFAMAPLDEQVRAFQRVYELPVTGVPADIEQRLFRCYDLVSVDEVPPTKSSSSPVPTAGTSSFALGGGGPPQGGAPLLAQQVPASSPGGGGSPQPNPGAGGAETSCTPRTHRRSHRGHRQFRTQATSGTGDPGRSDTTSDRHDQQRRPRRPQHQDGRNDTPPDCQQEASCAVPGAWQAPKASPCR